jgi:hypothetical protein
MMVMHLDGLTDTLIRQQRERLERRPRKKKKPRHGKMEPRTAIAK